MKVITSRCVAVWIIASLLLAPGAFAADDEKTAFGSDQERDQSNELGLMADDQPLTAYGWGGPDDGKIGDGSASVHRTPIPAKSPQGVGTFSDVAQVSTGDSHTLALLIDGTVWGWGNNQNGRLGDGTTTSRGLPVQVVGDGGVGVLQDVVQVHAGVLHSIAVKNDGTVWAWGKGSNGRLGDGSTINTDRHTPTQVVGPGGNGFLTNIIAISAAGAHNLALRDDGTLWGWGANSDGQLGDGTTTQRRTPVQVLGPDGVGFLTNIVQASAGNSNSLAVAGDGSLWSWGRGFNGQIGDGDEVRRTTPVQVVGEDGVGFLGDVEQASVGNAFGIAMKNDGTVWSWGVNSAGRLGDGTTTKRTTPVQVVGPDGIGFLQGVEGVSTQWTHTLAVRNDGTVWAWGSNSNGVLGDASTASFSHTPVQAVGLGGAGNLQDMTQVAAGRFHSVALNGDGEVWGWGRNSDAQLGDDWVWNRIALTSVLNEDWSPFEDVTQVVAGRWHSLALKQDGAVWAWGSNEKGQLGDGTNEDSNTPVQVRGPDGNGFLADVVQIAAGADHSMALKEDGTVWAWGDNAYGNLGDGAWFSQSMPVQVLGPGGVGFLTNIVQIAGGGHWSDQHSLALDSNGAVWGWGSDFEGQLGIGGTNTEHNTPVQMQGPGGVGVMEDIVEVAAGNAYSMVVKADGTLWTVGENWDGRLGDGTIFDRVYPVQVKGPDGVGVLKNVSTVAAGDGHSLAVKSDGTAWAWGRNWHGHLGDGTYDQREEPVQVRGVDGVGFLQDVVDVEAGEFHSMALGSNNQAWAWGDNSVGQMGVAKDRFTVWESTTPMVVMDPQGVEALKDVRSISAGSDHSLAVVGGILPSPPQDLVSIAGPAEDEITLTWMESEVLGDGDFTGYRVRTGSAPGQLGTAVDVGNVLEWTDTGLAPGTTRYYQVSGVSSLGEGGPSNTSSTSFSSGDPPPMPEGRSATSAAFEGDFAYIFGGRSEDGNATDSIIRYDVDANEVEILDSDLPSPRLGTSAVWSGNPVAGDFGAECHPNCFNSKMFVFGGLDTHVDDGQMSTACHPNCMSVGKEILEFDPVDGSVTVRNAEFDAALYGTSAVWDTTDEVSYIFGGFSEDDGSGGHALGALCHPNCMAGRSIRVYDPGTDSVATHDAHLPVALGGTSAVWDASEQVAYIFGGFNDGGDEAGAQCHPNCMRGILRFDPNADAQSQSVDPMPVDLPSDRWNTSATFDGRYAYIIGGEDRTGPINEIVRFDPIEMEVTVVGSLPTARTQSSAITDGSDTFIFGGLEQGNVTTDEIVRFSPSSPQSLSAQVGPGAGEIQLSWSPPVDDGGEPIVAYRVYRGDETDAPHELIETLPAVNAASDNERLTFTDSGLELLDSRYYRVSAVNAIGEGPSTKQTVGRTYDPFNIYLTPDGASLQQAAELLAPSGTIHLAGGNYQGNVLLEVPATLQPGVKPENGAQDAHEGPPVIVGGIETTADLELYNLMLEEGANGLPVLRTAGSETVQVHQVTIVGTGLSQTGSLVELGYPSTGDVDIQFVQNKVVDAAGTGLRITGDNPAARLTVVENHFQDNHDAAVVDGAGYGSLRFDRNLVEGQSGTGFRFNGAVEGETVLRTNQFQGNTLAVAVTDETTRVDARYNWWGHSSGPAALGDPVEMPLVDYTPWCLQEDCGLGEQIESLGLP